MLNPTTKLLYNFSTTCSTMHFQLNQKGQTQKGIYYMNFFFESEVGFKEENNMNKWVITSRISVFIFIITSFILDAIK
jgi:hypothetical protein